MKTYSCPGRIAFISAIILAIATTALGDSSKNKKKERPEPYTPTVVDKVMATYDLNHDGKLTFDEIKLFAAAYPSDAPTAKKYDLNNDYILTADEIATWKADIARDAQKSKSSSKDK